MTADELIALFRTETADTETPYLWTSEEAITYLNDAYVMLTRFLGGVADSSSSICTVAYVSGATAVAIDASVLRVVRAFRASDGVELSVIENTDTPLVRDAAGNLTLLRVGSSTGPVQFLVLGSDPQSAALHPKPNASGSIVMQIRRLPLAALVSGASPVDVRVEHHIHLLKWMKSMAYRKQDVETFDMDRAQANEALFLQYCSQAVHEQERMRRKSRMSLRSGRDTKNPLLAGNNYRSYTAVLDPGQRRNPPTQGEGQ